MITAVSTFKHMDWAGWGLGIMRSMISGGAGAVTSGVTVGILDPHDWNIHSGHLFELIGITFVGTGLIHMMTFLQTHPVPDIKEDIQ